MEKVDELLTRGVSNIVPSKEDLKKLLQSRKITIYTGFDVTANRLHLGHTVPFRKLQGFAELGHNVIFLIGDFTTLIGDNSDKESERPALTYEQIQENFKTYKEQASKVLDFNIVKVKFNSEWLSKLNFEEVVKLCQHFSVGDFISRELVKKRLQSEKRVGLHELLYPVMQAYDHYAMDTDLQMGATEQTFNLQSARTLQKELRGKDSFFMTMDILEGTDGRRMSKSWGNAIWITDEPIDMYRKVMAIRDDLIMQYATLATNIPMDELPEMEKQVKKDPMTTKKKLAFTVVSELHSKKDAEEAEEDFRKRVQEGERPTEIPEIKFTKEQKLEDLLTTKNIIASKSEVKRLGEQGGLTINDKKVKSDDMTQEGILRIGKTRHYKLVLS
jgi:tyrosyl-tRNA synthetase